MKLGIVTLMRGAAWGGSEELWYRTALAAIERGWRLHLTCFPNALESDQVKQLRRMGVEVAALEWMEGRTPWARVWRKARPPLRGVTAFGADVVVVNNGTTYEWTEVPGIRQAAWQWRDAGTRAYMLCHCNHESWMPEEWQAKIVREVWPMMEGVGFCTEVFPDLTERQMLMPVPRGFVFKNPVNLRSLEAVDWPADSVARFATVCRQDMTKGVDVALHVLAGERWKKREWVFDVYGAGPLREYLEGLARYLGHDPRRVRFRGTTGDVRKVWEENHVLLLTSRLEGLPLAMVEAAMCGRVIVTTDVGGVKTWCDAGGVGFVAAAPTVASVGEAMEEMWDARERWVEMGAEARRYALGWYGKAPELELLDRLAGVVECPAKPAAEVAGV